MAPTFAPSYVKPGVYVKQLDISTPAVAQGARIGGLIGQGNKTSPRLDHLVRGALDGTDGPLLSNIAIEITQIVDQNNVVYLPGVSFNLVRPTPTTAAVSWSPKATVTGVDLTTIGDPQTVLNGLTLNLAVNGMYPNAGPVLFSPPFPGGDTPAGIVAFINSWDPGLAGVASLGGNGNQLVLSADTILVDNGTANSILGLSAVAGMPQSVPKPATGFGYNVYYTSDKLANEYTKVLYASVNDVITDRGLAQPQTSLASGTVTGATATGPGQATLTDATQNWVPNAYVGNYVKIVSGPGQGQVRVVIANTANTLTLSQPWNAGNVPNAGSAYNLTDINNNTLSMGAYVFTQSAKANGGQTFVICTQYADDIFNPANITGAIDDLQTDISGQRPYSLVLMQGVTVANQNPITYLLNHCTTMSNTYNNKWRQCVFGPALNSTNFLDFVTMATGNPSDRLVIVNLSDLTIAFNNGTPVVVDGSYLAAAHAGIICANVDAGEPITRKGVGTVFSVDAYTENFLENEKDLMAANGVTIYERQGSDIKCRHALNTATATVLSQETKLTRSKDDISLYLQTNLDAAVTGQRFVIDPATGLAPIAGDVEALIDFLLRAKQNVNQQVITSFSAPTAVQDPMEPRQLDITCDIYLTTDVLWTYALLGFGVG